MMPSARPSAARAVGRGLSATARDLCRLARGLIDAGSMLEERYWEGLLAERLNAALQGSQASSSIEQALNSLTEGEPLAASALADVVEDVAESLVTEDGAALLVALPILCWSGQTIASGPISTELAAEALAALESLLAAEGTRVCISPFLYSPDQLPQGPLQARSLLKHLVASGASVGPKPRKPPGETVALMVDTRFFLASIAVSSPGLPIWRWQTDTGSADDQKAKWSAALEPVLNQALPGCRFEAVMPNGFFSAIRRSEGAVRPYSVHASLSYLQRAYAVEPAKIGAVLGQFGESQAQEIRIGFRQLPDHGIIHGVVWPLLNPEEAADVEKVIGDVAALLTDQGVKDIHIHPNLFTSEFCDDCGTPLYADRQGDIVHPEPDDDASTGSHVHLH